MQNSSFAFPCGNVGHVLICNYLGIIDAESVAKIQSQISEVVC